MNEAQANSSAPELVGSQSQPEGRAGGWSRKKWLIMVALVFAGQVAIIFVLGEKQVPPPRAVKIAPHMTLADSFNELIALDDPTLFVLPHANDFASAVWNEMPIVPQPAFRWPATNAAAPLATENLGAVFTRFMQTNQFAAPVLEFKPEPALSEPVFSVPPAFAGNSSLQIEGELAQRKLLVPISLTNWPYAGVITPSKVQVLVDASGRVVQAVLLPPDKSIVLLPSANADAVRYNAADRRALELARSARFSASSRLTVGQLVFHWCTVPPPATNSPVVLP
jgi:hypothetical protein